jgi:sensor histidine kinase YesM
MYISNEIEEIEEYSRMKIELSEQIAETERQSAEAEKQRAEAEKRKLDSERSMHFAFENKMNLLLGQMQPHFVYNSLATIRALVSVDPDGAIETIDHFSSYLRESLAITDGTKLVPFSEELQLIEDYLYMEKRRFGDKVNIERDIQTTEFEVPPLAIQTLVENAVRHGIRAKNNPGTITISTYEDEAKYYVEIKDDGVGFDTLVKSDGKHHIGTASTRARVKELLGGKMVIQSALGAGTRITVHIPKRV